MQKAPSRPSAGSPSEHGLELRMSRPSAHSSVVGPVLLEEPREGEAVKGRTASGHPVPAPVSPLWTASLGLFLELWPPAGMGPSLCRVRDGQGKGIRTGEAVLTTPGGSLSFPRKKDVL